MRQQALERDAVEARLLPLRKEPARRGVEGDAALPPRRRRPSQRGLVRLARSKSVSAETSRRSARRRRVPPRRSPGPRPESPPERPHLEMTLGDLGFEELGERSHWPAASISARRGDTRATLRCRAPEAGPVLRRLARSRSRVAISASRRAAIFGSRVDRRASRTPAIARPYPSDDPRRRDRRPARGAPPGCARAPKRTPPDPRPPPPAPRPSTRSARGRGSSENDRPVRA